LRVACDEGAVLPTFLGIAGVIAFGIGVAIYGF
jgi:hypothetical protein